MTTLMRQWVTFEHQIFKGPTTINWAATISTGKVDPYLIWYEMARPKPALKHPWLLLELRSKYTLATCKIFRKKGLSVPAQYLSVDTCFVTAWLEKAEHMKYVQAEVDSHGLIVRYELSVGYANPDARVEGGRPCQAITTTPIDADLVGFVDYGCAFAHRQFRDDYGALRVAAIWNQQDEIPYAAPRRFGLVSRLGWAPLANFEYGKQVLRDELVRHTVAYVDANGKFDEESCYRDADYDAICQHATHGTHIIDVATGSPNPLAHNPSDEQEQQNKAKHVKTAIVFVQLPRGLEGIQVSGLLRAHVLDALRYIHAMMTPQRRAVINLSYGSYCGPHDGTSILELAMDELLESVNEPVGGEAKERLNIVIPSGNSLDWALHAQVYLRFDESQTLLWNNVPDDPSDSFVELWLPAHHGLAIRVTPPGMNASEDDWVKPGDAPRLLTEDGRVIAALTFPKHVCQSPRGTMCLLAVAATVLEPKRPGAPYGEWQIELRNQSAGPITVDAWCERDDPVFGNEGGPRQSQFASHVERTGTLNSIGHGYRTRIVGGYVAHGEGYFHEPNLPPEFRPVAKYSGTGPGRGLAGRERHLAVDCKKALSAPDALAPSGESAENPGIAAAAVMGDEQIRLAGTSVATAYATRRIIDSDFVWYFPKAYAPVCDPGSDEDDPPHPDDCEVLPRFP